MKENSDLTDRQIEIYSAYTESDCNEVEVAEKFGITTESVRKTLYLCAKKGKKLTPDKFCPEAPPGFGMTFSTIHTRNGEIVNRWDRIKPLEVNSEISIEYLSHRVPVNNFDIKPPTKIDHEMMLEWTLADLHYGMYAWGRETGEDYDIKIARDLLLDSGSDIFSRSGKIKKVVLVLAGDNIHSDFKSNQTEMHHHPLDVDGRYAKVIETGIDMFATAIEMCLMYAELVEVIVLFGNHDNHSSVWLQYTLHYYFRNEYRVSVNLSPSKERYNFWGCTGIIYHHGNMTKPERIANELLLHIAKNDIRGIRFFYAKQAHLHREEIKDINGVTFEYIPSPVAKDSFAAHSLYSAKRATVATLFHTEYGECDRFSVTPYGLERKSKIISDIRNNKD
jgi:hypothetical protein